MRRLILFRHAKSAWPQGVPDNERPLAERGRLAAPLMGAYIARHGLVPDLALVSPARRTEQTWHFATADWPRAPRMEFEPAIYEAHVERLLRVVKDQEKAVKSLMLVGHNPGLADLMTMLVSRNQRSELPGKYPTAGLSVIDLPVDDWGDITPRLGTLERFITPKSLGGEEDA
ncbi:histidine phosphatase family protein [Starkeya sp. ORNL1]|uniref:SixA phosphatase family protein n=1 Tax=Starkeya sp. ORNL1 TaxID=2709380 RepID=UPI001462D0E3|nr:histidine phosphatase family protein [Starkeya sp. ORNL1]QJP12294.1 histidine phosphatase family protein [Starkeya sp. ORNL1]